MGQDTPPSVEGKSLDQCLRKEEQRLAQAPEQWRAQVGYHKHCRHRHVQAPTDVSSLINQVVRRRHRLAQPAAELDDSDCLAHPQHDRHSQPGQDRPAGEHSRCGQGRPQGPSTGRCWCLCDLWLGLVRDDLARGQKHGGRCIVDFDQCRTRVVNFTFERLWLDRQDRRIRSFSIRWRGYNDDFGRGTWPGKILKAQPTARRSREG